MKQIVHKFRKICSIVTFVNALGFRNRPRYQSFVFRIRKHYGTNSSRLCFAGHGAVVGVFSGVIGEILAELFLDKLRLRHAKQYEPLLEPESETPQ